MELPAFCGPRARLIQSPVLNREHPAEEVYVTGTFDNWSKSTKLEKVGTAHEKTVELAKTDDKIWYKVSRRRLPLKRRGCSCTRLTRVSVCGGR